MRRRGRHLRRAPLALAASLAAAALAACGSDSEPAPEPAAQGVGEVQVGSVAPLAECRDWVGASEPERLATIADIRSQINLENGTAEAPALSDEQAAELFDGACAESYAASFRLYKLYVRRAAFQPLLEP